MISHEYHLNTSTYEHIFAITMRSIQLVLHQRVLCHLMQGQRLQYRLVEDPMGSGGHHLAVRRDCGSSEVVVEGRVEGEPQPSLEAR